MPENSCKIYASTEETWEAMLEACERAEVSIDIEQYIFTNDEIGARFLEIFKRKAREGVRIRLLIDTAGSYAFYQSSVPSELRKLGIEVRFFNIISPWRIHNFFSWFFRNHKKTLVVDGRVGFTGGTGIGYHMRSWRDTNGRVEGEVVREMTDCFLEMWELANDRDLLSRLRKWRSYREKVDFVTNSPYFKKRFLYHTLLRELLRAKKSIFLTTPYLIPDRRLIRTLRKAVKRGVEIKIIVPEVLDVLIVATASNSSFEELLKAGVRIFRYQPRILHAKTAVVDEEWATYGSFNLDSLSFRYNYEANIVTYDPYSASEIQKHFLADIKESREVLLSEWKRRPLVRKVQEFFVAPFRGFL